MEPSNNTQTPCEDNPIPIEAFESLLKTMNLHGPNFDHTALRAAKVWSELIHRPMPRLTTFPLTGKPGMIAVKNHVTWSFCPHHLLPVKYTLRIGYIPNRQVLGLSKLARIADYVMKDLPLQEEIAFRIADMIEQTIEPKGVGVIVNGEHLCMQMRGLKSPCVNAVSSFMSGVFLLYESTREEFISI